MRVLLDNGAPRGITSYLRDHTVAECRELGWDTLSNGELLFAAETAGFEVLVTTDKNIRYQQNLKGRKLALVVLGKGRWRIVRNSIAQICAAVDAATQRSKFRSRS